MNVQKIGNNKYKITYSYLFGLFKRQKTVIIDYNRSYVNFSNYHPLYNFNTGEHIPLYQGINIEDKINNLKRLEEWES